MIWQELSIQVPSEYVEPVSYLFGKYGHGLSIEGAGDQVALLRTYLPSTSKLRRARIEVGLKLVRILRPMGELEIKDLDSSDWENAWKAHFNLLKVSARLVIKPPWINYVAKPEEVVIELDPGMAFGTGYHPTTKMCLVALDEIVRPGMEILDLGTGSGILAIAAARLGASSVLAMDIDPTAVKTAKRNFKAVDLMGHVRLARGTLPNSLAQESHFDLAVANISAKTIGINAQNLYLTLKPGGTLIASGFIEDQQREIEDVLENVGFRNLKTYSEEDWVALVMSKSI